MSEKRYVECESLLKSKDWLALQDRDRARAKAIVLGHSTADVVEVVHGEWVEQLDGTHYCSECGRDATYTYDGTEICGIGCPFCYAKMDGKGDT